MKIAHVVDSMEIGGAETLVYQLCRLQREQGHDPRVYAVSRLGALGERMRQEGFVVEANVARHLPSAVGAFYNLFRQFSPGVAHLHNALPTIYAALAARLAGARTVTSTRHGLVSPPHKRVTELKYGLAAVCCNWVVGICDATVANLKDRHTMSVRKIVRVYNGVVPIERVPPERWPSKTGFTLLFVGRLAPVKNLSFLLSSVTGDGHRTGGLKPLVRGLKNDAESVLIAQTLEETAWNRKAAAASLQISYKALLYKIKQYSLSEQERI